MNWGSHIVPTDRMLYSSRRLHQGLCRMVVHERGVLRSFTTPVTGFGVEQTNPDYLEDARKVTEFVERIRDGKV